MVFHPNFNHPLTIFHHKLPAREARVWDRERERSERGDRATEERERAWRESKRGAGASLVRERQILTWKCNIQMELSSFVLCWCVSSPLSISMRLQSVRVGWEVFEEIRRLQSIQVHLTCVHEELLVQPYQIFVA